MLRARPVMRTRAPIRVVRRRRRWHRITWWYSVLLVIPVVLIFADRVFGVSPVEDNKSSAQTIGAVTFRITDAASAQAVAGAEVRAGDVAATSDGQGVASLELPAGAVIVTVSRDGYEPVYGRADGSVASEQKVALRALAVEAAQEELAQDDGGAPVEDDAGGEEPDAPAPSATAVEDAVVPGELAGLITTEDGDPIRGAMVRVGRETAKTKRDGTFRLGDVPDEGELVVSASGYADQKLALPAEGAIEVALVRQQIEAVYLTGPNAANPDIVDELIRIADETEINAIVVDIKENYVWYDTGVQFFQDAEAVDPKYDPRELVEKLHEHGIYAIARTVIFNDPIVAENRPDLAVADEDGGVWRGADGGAWVIRSTRICGSRTSIWRLRRRRWGSMRFSTTTFGSPRTGI